MKMAIVNSYPTRARGIIVKYFSTKERKWIPVNWGGKENRHWRVTSLILRSVQARKWSSSRKCSRDRNWFHCKKLGMAWPPWKVYGWIHILLIILGEEKTSTSGIKSAIKNVSHTAQNTKLTCVDCINFSFRKRAAKRNMNLWRCLCHLINRVELFPVHFLHLRPR